MLSETAGIYMARERKAKQSSYEPIQETHKVKTFHKYKILSAVFTWYFKGFPEAAAVLERAEQMKSQLSSIMLDIKATHKYGKQCHSSKVF